MYFKSDIDLCSVNSGDLSGDLDCSGWTLNKHFYQIMLEFKCLTICTFVSSKKSLVEGFTYGKFLTRGFLGVDF